MTTMEMEQRKGALQEIIAQLSSEEEVAKVEKLLHHFLSKTYKPCQFTIKELEIELETAEKEAEQGLGYTIDQLRKEALTW